MSSKLERNDKIKLLLHNSHLSYKRNEEPSYKKYFKLSELFVSNQRNSSVHGCFC